MVGIKEGGAGVDPLLVTIPEAGRMSGFSRSEIYRRLGTGELEARKVGRSTRIVVASLRRAVASLPKAQFRSRTKLVDAQQPTA